MFAGSLRKDRRSRIIFKTFTMKDQLEAVLDGNGLPGLNPGNVNGRIDDGAVESEMEFRRRYRLCRELMEKREQLRVLSELEKDAVAERIARQEYLDLSSDWAFKHLFGKHKDLLLMLLRDILNEPMIREEQNQNRTDGTL